MAKVIKYKLCTVVTHQKEILIDEESGQVEYETWEEEVLSSVTLPYSEKAENIAKREAYKGEYTIEDDGKPEPETEASTDDVLNTMLGVV